MMAHVHDVLDLQPGTACTQSSRTRRLNDILEGKMLLCYAQGSSPGVLNCIFEAVSGWYTM